MGQRMQVSADHAKVLRELGFRVTEETTYWAEDVPESVVRRQRRAPAPSSEWVELTDKPYGGRAGTKLAEAHRFLVNFAGMPLDGKRIRLHRSELVSQIAHHMGQKRNSYHTQIVAQLVAGGYLEERDPPDLLSEPEAPDAAA